MYTSTDKSSVRVGLTVPIPAYAMPTCQVIMSLFIGVITMEMFIAVQAFDEVTNSNGLSNEQH